MGWWGNPAPSCSASHPLHAPKPTTHTHTTRPRRDKLLYAAREGLRGVRGRVSLVPAETSIEPVLLAGAMALLEQVWCLGFGP